MRATVITLLIGFALFGSAHAQTGQLITFEEAKQRADQGDAFAQAVIALHYQLGWNTQKNPELAAKYALASANAGEPLGQFRLGALMRAGEGVAKDEEQGFAYQSASFDGLNAGQDPYSITAVGIMIFQGKVVGQNVSEDDRRRDAAALYKKAADMGYAPAQFNYAMCAEMGHGVPKSSAVRLDYLTRARDSGYGLALDALQSATAQNAALTPSELRAYNYDQGRAFQQGVSNPVSMTLAYADVGSSRRISLAAESQPKSLAAEGIFSVVQQVPAGIYFSDVTLNGKTVVFVLGDKLSFYEIGSGRLIKTLPFGDALHAKVYFRHGNAASLLVCDSATQTIREVSVDDGQSKAIKEDFRGSILGYDAHKDCLFYTDGQSISRVNVETGEQEVILGSSPLNVSHVLVGAHGTIGIVGMNHEGVGEPSSWIDAFSSSSEGFSVVHRGSEAVKKLAAFLGTPPKSPLRVRKQKGWELMDLWTDVVVGGKTVWLDQSVNLLPKPGWLLTEDEGLLSLQNGISACVFPPSTVLLAEGISASESGDDLLWWSFDGGALLSLVESGGEGLNSSVEMNSASPQIFRPKEFACEQLPLGDLVFWNATLDASGGSACFVVTELSDPKSMLLRQGIERYSSETWEFKSRCIVYNVADRSVKIGNGSAPMWPLDNEYTDGKFWYFDFGQPFRHSRIAVKDRRYSGGAAVWEWGEGRPILVANPTTLVSESEEEETLDTKTGLLARWSTSSESKFVSGHGFVETYSSFVTWAKDERQLSSIVIDGTVHDVFQIDDVKALVWVNQSLLMFDVEKASALSTIRYGTRGFIKESGNRIAVCPDASSAYVLADDGAIFRFEWDAKGELRELFRIYPQLKSDPMIATPEGFYTHLSRTVPGIHFSDGTKTFPFEQFDLRLNRPDIILERLGAPEEAVVIAKQLREKRLKRTGVTEEMLKPDFHVPEVEIVGDVPSTTDAGEINLEIKASDSKYPLERLKVFVNNVPVNGRDGELVREEGKAEAGLLARITGAFFSAPTGPQTLERTIPIKLAAGRNKIQVSVLNNAGAESLYANAEVNCTAKRPKPTLYAVAMGVSDYSNPDWNLKYAAKDARDVLAKLKAGSSDNYGEVKELLLTDEEVTKESIAKIKDFLKSATIDDTVLMFVAGHGLLDSNYDYFFGTSDIDFNNPAAAGIAFEEFDDLLAELPSLKKSLLIDTCHAGELDQEEKSLLASAGGVSAALPTANGVAVRSIGTRGMNVKAVEGARGASEWYDRLQGLFVDLRRGSGSTILSSSAGAEYALESSEQQNGLFTYAVLEALDGKKDADANKDGSVQMSELGEYVKKRVSELTNNKQTPNTRRVNLEGDFTLARTQ